MQALGNFETITLSEMDSVKLMNRTDTKYTFHANELENILENIQTQYRVLEIENSFVSTYKTLYYDTQELNLYYHHHQGKLNRYKVRHRTYVESEIGFLEVKFKNNKGRTIKTRIKQNQIPLVWNEKSLNFLNAYTPYIPEILVPTINVNYQRITLVNKFIPERLTIDLNLEFERNGILVKPRNLIIAEIKQENLKNSHFIDLMKKKHIRTGSISKYCMSIAYSIPNVKYNSFKPKILKIKKLEA
jgi:hypothetical protein